jgi:nucleoside-diphosphate-sugar epimerase
MLAVFGAAGAIGKAVSAEAKRRGVPVRVVGRSAATLRLAFGDDHEIVAADLANADDAKRAAAGAESIVHAVGVRYNHFELHPLLMQRVIEAARAQAVRKLVVISNVYSYGLPIAAPVDETHPRNPATYKGRMRKQQEDLALAANSPTLKTVVLRLPDFYSVDAENSAANEIFKAARDGKAAPVFAPVDRPHEWVYTPDVGAVIFDLLARDDVYGTAYNLAGAGRVTIRDFAARIYEQFGQELKLRIVSTAMLRVLGLFNPILRELVEMQYLQSTPVILDDAKLSRVLGAVKKTTYADGIAATVAALCPSPV